MWGAGGALRQVASAWGRRSGVGARWGSGSGYRGIGGGDGGRGGVGLGGGLGGGQGGTLHKIERRKKENISKRNYSKNRKY